MATFCEVIFEFIASFSELFFGLVLFVFFLSTKCRTWFSNKILKKAFSMTKSEDLQRLVLSKCQKGESTTKIFRDLNGSVSSRTVRRWCEVLNDMGSINLSYSSDRPRIIRAKGTIQKVKNRMNGKKWYHSVDHQRYINEMLPLASEYDNNVFDNEWCYQQEGAKPHTHAGTQE